MLQILILFISLSLCISSGEAFIKQSQLKKEILSEMQQNKPYAQSEVDSRKKEQALKLHGAAFHQKSCVETFTILGNYESYKDIIGFIKSSRYNEKSKKVFFRLSHFLLPFDMILNFKIPRIRKPGMYQFTFDSGFLSGLVGEIVVEPLNNPGFSCFISVDINWSGPSSPFPDFIFEYFSKVLLKKSITRLWEKSAIIFRMTTFINFSRKTFSIHKEF